MRKESRKKNQQIRKIRANKTNANLGYDEESFLRNLRNTPVTADPFTKGVFNAGPVSILSPVDEEGNFLSSEDMMKNFENFQQESIITGAVYKYPDNADENIDIHCDNGIISKVNMRAFIAIRTRHQEKMKSLMLEHKDAMMKKEAEWLTKMENEKIELGKQISIRDQMVLEARAETNEYKSMNQSILSQISDKEAKIAQVRYVAERF